MNIPVLFVDLGLRDNLRAEAMREHPRILSDAFVVARVTARLSSVVYNDVRKVTPNTQTYSLGTKENIRTWVIFKCQCNHPM